ncbi:MAG: CocE/NonD family hydrolase [Bryobacteraceae bacterium]
MRKGVPLALLVCALSIALSLRLHGAANRNAPSVSNEDVWLMKIPMRDGVRLSARLFRPAGAGKLPTILIRTPYGKDTDSASSYRGFLKRGYNIVVQDVRGRYGSEGSFRPLEQESGDGNDTLNWIARQNWSNGDIGMIGGSYRGIVQWKAAIVNNPHLKAIFPVVSGSDEYRDRFYSPGGVMKLGHRLLWMAENLRAPSFSTPSFAEYVRHLPLRTIDSATTGHSVEFFQEALNHPNLDAYWNALSTREHLDRVRIPAFIVGGWYDNYAQSDLETYSILAKRTSANRIVIGPWPHDMSIKFADIDLGKDSGAPIRTYQLEWFDHWLKLPQPAPEFRQPPVHIFVMGSNKWRDEREWPLARTRYTPLYLSGKGNANTAKGDGLLTGEPHKYDLPDDFAYDPRNPVPTNGGAICCNPRIFPWGPKDQSEVEARDDVLVFSTPPLKQDLEVTGPIRVVLYASTSQPDTDFTAKLVDVLPSGVPHNLTDGALRLRYRNSLDQPVLAHPGEIYQISIDTGVTSNVFRAGHKIRVEISSSNFPRFDRNPNTGGTIADEKELRVANQRIYHGKQYPSYLLLPVIP